MRLRDLFRGLRGLIWGLGISWVKEDPMGPSGLFDESPDEAYVLVINGSRSS